MFQSRDASTALLTDPKYLGGTINTEKPTTTLDTGMYKKLIAGLALHSLLGTTPLLSACRTTAGTGQDIAATGKGIEKSAGKHTP